MSWLVIDMTAHIHKHKVYPIKYFDSFLYKYNHFRIIYIHKQR